MSHLRITVTPMFAEEMVRSALAHPPIVERYRQKAWQHADVTFNDIGVDFTIRRHGDTQDIEAHCEVEHKGHRVIRGILELTIEGKLWEFSGYLVGNQVVVTAS